MRVLIFCVGTRGDVEPFIALARAAEAAGHDALVCSTHEHEDLCARSKVSFASVGESIADDPEMFKIASTSLAAFEAGKITAAEMQKQQMAMLTAILGRVSLPHSRALMAILDAAASEGKPFDLAITTILGHRSIQPHLEARNLVLMLVDLQPIFRTNYGNLPMQGRAEGFLGSNLMWWYRKAIWGAYQRLLWGAFLKKSVNDCRTLAGLDTLSYVSEYYARMHRAPTILGYLEELTPTPYPPKTNELRDVRAQGVLMLDDHARSKREALPADLEAFLAAGPPPVYIGFGSMRLAARHVTTVVLQAVKQAGGRCVLAAGWAELGTHQLDPASDGTAELLSFAKSSVFEISSVDHRMLLPRCASAVCHAGAGTFAAVLLAGIPIIACPFAFDQFDFARAGVGAGVSPGFAPLGDLTADVLADLILKAAAERPQMEPNLKRIQAAMSPPDRTAKAAVAAMVDVLREHKEESMWTRPVTEDIQPIRFSMGYAMSMCLSR